MEYPVAGTLAAFIEQRLLQIQKLEAQIEGAITLHLQEMEIQGAWRLDWPKRQLVLAEPQSLAMSQADLATGPNG